MILRKTKALHCYSSLLNSFNAKFKVNIYDEQIFKKKVTAAHKIAQASLDMNTEYDDSEV